jgi:tRNA pseudouridine38-40 synthase
MATFKITLTYDGTGFVGWQRQASGTSIQGVVEDALRELDQRDVTVIGAGRTDAGVHALGQVASFALHRSMTADALLRAVNARLPDSVRVIAAEEVAGTFHARFGARRKLYRYRIWNAETVSPFERAYAWHLPGPLDIDAMRVAAGLVEGQRDFAAFRAAGSATRSSERVVFSSVVLTDRHIWWRSAPPQRLRSAMHGEPESSQVAVAHDRPAESEALPDRPSPVDGPGTLIEYEVAGSGFLRHMVRNIVGSLVEIGRGRRPIDWMTTIVEGRDRTLSGPTAPAHGLVLVAVEYGGRPSCG